MPPVHNHGHAHKEGHTPAHTNSTAQKTDIQTVPHSQGKKPCVNRHPPQTSIFTVRLKVGRSE